MVFILVGQDILLTKLLMGQKSRFCPFLVIKVPIIGGAAAHPAPPITPSLINVANKVQTTMVLDNVN